MRLIHDRPQAAAGAKHTICCTVRGDVFTFGHGDNGRLGNRECKGMLTPMQLHALDGVFVMQVSAGEAHSGA